MGNVLIFALIGLLAGTAARILYPGRQLMRILGTLVLGMVGGAGRGDDFLYLLAGSGWSL